MRLGFLLGQPTQFEGPFFRHAAAAGGATITVLYVDSDGSSSVYDPELDRRVAWGIDLLTGYEHRTLPREQRLRWLWDELRPSRYDWLIINGYTAWPYLAALGIARLRGIRTALRIDSVLYNVAGWRKQLVKRWVIGALSKVYDRFFATGTLAREYLLRFGVDSERIALFPYTVDTSYFSSQAESKRAERDALRRGLGIPADAHVALAVAKFNRREAPWDLLGALERLDRPDLWTVFVGDGEQGPALRARVQAQGLRRVLFAGYVPYAELVSYYALADVFVHAAANEPWGVSVHEAIACGLRVVASSHVGAAHDLIQQGRNGFIYEAGNAAELAERLVSALDRLDPDVLRSANREVLARWNYDAAWRNLLETVGA